MIKRIALLLALCLLMTSGAVAEKVLPSLGAVFGVEMPSLRRTALVDPDKEESLADGSRQLTFLGITEEQFNAYSSYLTTFGCELADYSVTGSTLTAVIAKGSATFTFVYDYATLRAVVTYPQGTNEEPVNVAALKRLNRLETIKVGDYITFGHYPQTADGTDNTPIEWLVLEVQGNNALVISRYGLDAHRFDASTYQGWEKSEIRAWLNSDFMNRAFTAAEQSAILVTNVDNSPSQAYSGYYTDGGNNTQDKLFLLSYAEANKYLNVQHYSVDGATDNTKSRAVPTAYAVKQGAYQSSSNKLDGIGCCWWWLRSPGYISHGASRVFIDGSLYYNIVDDTYGAARPAFWLNIDSADIY